MDDTIFALASAPGVSGVAVLRISGPRSAEVYMRLTGQDRAPQPKQATLRKLYHPDTNIWLDSALCLYFKAPHSFTGEDVLELHIHGGRAVLASVSEAIFTVEGVRYAEAGEFSKRGFLNGKMDLTEAEGIVDLVHAETAAQASQALKQMDGQLGALYDQWRDQLVKLLAHGEAFVDFVEEDDIPQDLWDMVIQKIGALQESLQAHLSDNHRGEKLREGITVAIIGPPNAGKSSLMNLLARQDVAIVSDIAGTTRDVVQVSLDLSGYPVTLVDTAGIRETDDVIEREGVKRARKAAAHADLRVLVLDASQTCGQIPAEFKDIAEKPNTLCIFNKIDLVNLTDASLQSYQKISVSKGQGIEALLEKLTSTLDQLIGQSEAPVITRARHRDALETASQHLQNVLRESAKDMPFELVIEDIRLAARALGKITGRIDVEDLLDVVFRDFCIGK